ncbi:hypothetical protein AWB78_07347 [Caballeronia calidae]|uniref:Uncharacterized protein n=1 Tax=Caballeronia calidae TaxID=1777139 RepID=A0A158EE77_9BURK|nr:hypothetical protein [Caballeronia calidae]SAL05191.1 hypothetical protein AWB78_07347 [Caballeronia calidae]
MTELVEMPSSRRQKLKRKPVRGSLVHYQKRVVEVMGEARGYRVMIRSIHPDGQERGTAVKRISRRSKTNCSDQA